MKKYFENYIFLAVPILLTILCISISWCVFNFIVKFDKFYEFTFRYTAIVFAIGSVMYWFKSSIIPIPYAQELNIPSVNVGEISVATNQKQIIKLINGLYKQSELNKIASTYTLFSIVFESIPYLI
jgi:hypothetical protein